LFMGFPNIGEPRTFRLGVKHISRYDPKIRQLVNKLGLIEFEAGGDPFESLVEAIISQQLSGKSARSIFNRVKALVRSDTVSAQALKKTPASKLRKAGISPQKSRYLKDLSSQVVNGTLNLDDLQMKPDDEVVQILDEAKGIGPWTAQMFLLFTLGRPDILPVDDLGIQTAIRKVYSLRKLPNAKKIEQIASKWHPYCSVASLYLWHSKDTK
jgi:DNA-3-methyladenine glycosylase II